jgi:Rad3-related DNA helicase
LALSREVALIQGPPGTGKSYVGVQIVRALVANCGGPVATTWTFDAQRGVQPPPESQRPLLFPILCVCYTNHALDQFLEDLVKKKIVSIDDVVRAGGRSRSELLQPRNLRELARQDRGDTKAYGKLRYQCGQLETEIDKSLKVTKATITWQKNAHLIEDWIRDYEVCCWCRAIEETLH